MKRCYDCMEEYEDHLDVCPHCGYEHEAAGVYLHFLQPGTILHDQYIVGTVIGNGGFGIVYKAWDNKLSRVVAIKEYFDMKLVRRIPGHSEITIYANKKGEFQSDIRRFLMEAQYLAMFSNHSSIINVYNYFEENNTAYIAMEYLDGITLDKFIKSQGGVIEIESAVSVTVSILEALKDIHKSNILHRDVAPDNIFLCFDGRTKLMDFGAARLTKDEENIEPILKPGFAPPEQYRMETKQCPSTDIYAVGAVLYLALTGQKPVESTNREEQDDLIAPIELNPKIPAKLNNIILRAMALQIDLRFQSAEEFIEVLNADYNREVRSIKEEIKHRKRMRLVKTLGATAVILAAAVACVGLYDMKKSEIDLKPATLNVWLQAQNSSSTADNFLSTLEDFSEQYPQIQLHVSVFNKSEYEEKLAKASASGNMPDVYMPVNYSINYETKDLSKLCKYIDAEDYYGLAMTETDKVYAIPITYAMPVVYISTSMEGYSDEAAMREYLSGLEQGAFNVDESKMQQFLNGEVSYAVADTSFYWPVQDYLGGKYSMIAIPVNTEQQSILANSEISLAVKGDVNYKQYNAALQMIYYLLGEKAQTKLTVEQHQGLPMKKEVYEKFIQLNTEFEILEQEQEALIFNLTE